MEDNRITAARNRIETALTRIEQSAANSSAQHNKLAEKHRALRQTVSASLVRLDELIGKFEQ